MTVNNTYVLDEIEKKIVNELIKDPRASDNLISRLTSVPVKTVNRKRKILEEKGFLNYYAYLDNFLGTKKFNSRQMYRVVLRHGITRDSFLKGIKDNSHKFFLNPLFSKHILESHLGEKNGHLVLILVLESFSKNDIIEIFNANVVNFVNDVFGNGSIYDTEVIDLSYHISILHNYVFSEKKLFNENNIFVSE